MLVVWIEDETELLKQCAEYLRGEDIEVRGATTLSEAEALIAAEKPDLLLVDWMLPGGESGLDICKRNDREWGLPMIMVTAKGDEFDKVLALELGADDYLTKPFGLRELGARIKAVLRRAARGSIREEDQRDDSRIQRGALVLDRVKFVAQLGDRRLELTRTEFMLLWKLASHPGRVFTRTHLMDEALGDDYIGYERTIDSHIRNMRKKLGDQEGAEFPCIETVYGIGYRFSEEKGEPN